MSRVRLVADVGGTNARFAWTDEAGGLGRPWNTPVASHDTFVLALQAFLDREQGPPPREAAIAAAGPLDDGEVRLTNAPWHIRKADMAGALPGARIGLFNDLEAAALALPYLEAHDVAPIGASRPLDRSARMLAVNVGTGFGAATAIPLGQGSWTACPGEAGHMSLSVRSAEERAVLEKMRLDAPTVEDVLSGAGFVALYRALGGEASLCAAETIIERHAADPAAGEALRLFTDWLGRVAGDLLLATSAWGGVCLVGGLIESWRQVADVARFHRAFAAKGKMQARMARVPAVVVLRKNMALLGLSHAPVPA